MYLLTRRPTAHCRMKSNVSIYRVYYFILLSGCNYSYRLFLSRIGIASCAMFQPGVSVFQNHPFLYNQAITRWLICAGIQVEFFSTMPEAGSLSVRPSGKRMKPATIRMPSRKYAPHFFVLFFPLLQQA